MYARVSVSDLEFLGGLAELGVKALLLLDQGRLARPALLLERRHLPMSSGFRVQTLTVQGSGFKVKGFSDAVMVGLHTWCQVIKVSLMDIQGSGFRLQGSQIWGAGLGFNGLGLKD